jgi:DNA-binding Lrp family transcriptional regulator
VQITQRDIALLQWTNGFGFVSVLQIAKWMGVDFSTAARRVRLLIEAGLIRRTTVDILSANPIVVTPDGALVAGDSLPPLKGIRTGDFRHDSLLVDMARGLTARFPRSLFEPVRRLRHSGALAKAKHLPDGYLHFRGHRYTIELELTVKSRQRLSAIMAEHTTDIGAKEIWYLTDSAMVAAAITRAAVGLDHVKIVRFAKNTATEP